MNLLEILKNAPKGLSLWCDVLGPVTFEGIDASWIKVSEDHLCPILLTAKGSYMVGNYPCVLWPSKECRTWNWWQISLFKKGDFIKDGPNIGILTDNGYYYTSDGMLVRVDNYQVCEYASSEEKDKYLTELNNNGFCWDKESLEMQKIFKIADFQIDTDRVSRIIKEYYEDMKKKTTITLDVTQEEGEELIKAINTANLPTKSTLQRILRILKEKV